MVLKKIKFGEGLDSLLLENMVGDNFLRKNIKKKYKLTLNKKIFFQYSFWRHIQQFDLSYFLPKKRKIKFYH